MFTAKDINENKIWIEDIIKGEKYFCPECGRVVVSKICRKKASHFAHKINLDCVDWCDKGEWHMEWQKKFPKEYREVVLDNGKEKHRADIIIKNKKLVIEFQHSYLPYEEFYKRNIFYTSCGYTIVWIFDAHKKVKNVNSYRIDPVNNFQGTKFFFNPKDYIEQELEWKNRQSTFENKDYAKGLPIIIFLETSLKDKDDIIFLHIHNIKEYDMTVYWHNSYIRKANLMKWFGFANEPNAKSFIEIVNESAMYRKALFSKMKYKN